MNLRAREMDARRSQIFVRGTGMMDKGASRLAAIAAFIAVASPLSALAYDFTVPAGVARQVWFSVSMNEDCSLMGEDVTRLTVPPGHGRATIRKVVVHPTFAASNPRHVCNTRSVTAPSVWYKPDAGYVGDDSMTVETITAGGAAKTVAINIHVR